LDGFLNVSKPSGCTSRDVVNRIQRLVRPDKVGHAGTLDPLAEGVLVVAIGQATKLIEKIQQTTKVYRGAFLLGHSSDTEDVEGEVVELPYALAPSESELSQACRQMCGENSQLPPQYSALKVGGKRAYDLARRGIKAELKPRVVRIDSCELLRYEYPEFELKIVCGSGTYVRSIGRDIAASLGSAAVMSALTRTAVGPFHLDEAIDLESIDEKKLATSLAPIAIAVADLVRLELTAEEVVLLGHGRQISDRFEGDWESAAAFASNGRLAAIVAPVSPDRIRSVKNFPDS
jgi:tRNA pseudouridine55 synthase